MSNLTVIHLAFKVLEQIRNETGTSSACILDFSAFSSELARELRWSAQTNLDTSEFHLLLAHPKYRSPGLSILESKLTGRKTFVLLVVYSYI